MCCLPLWESRGRQQWARSLCAAGGAECRGGVLICPGNQGNPLVDGVLPRGQWPGAEVWRGGAALDRLASGPVLPVGQVPEVDCVRGVDRVAGEVPAAFDLGRPG